MKKLIPLILYFFVAVLNLIANVYEDESLEFFSKIALMPLLAWFLYAQVAPTKVLPLLVLLAVFFSWIGDIMLLFDGKLFFILGLLSFLTAHVLYILAFRNNQKPMLFFRQNPVVLLPLLGLGGGFLFFTHQKLGEMLIPVIVYETVILTMTAFAWGRYPNSSQQSFWRVFAGACVFVISDLSLAINRFVSEYVVAGFVIMFTYILAQYLIVSGMCLEVREKYEKILP